MFKGFTISSYYLIKYKTYVMIVTITSQRRLNVLSTKWSTITYINVVWQLAVITALGEARYRTSYIIDVVKGRWDPPCLAGKHTKLRNELAFLWAYVCITVFIVIVIAIFIAIIIFIITIIIIIITIIALSSSLSSSVSLHSSSLSLLFSIYAYHSVGLP